MSRILKLFALSCAALLLVGRALAGVELPAGMKAEVGQYPESTVVQVVNMSGQEIAMIDCGAAKPEAVYGYYAGQAEKNGWKFLMQGKQADAQMLIGEKNGRQLSVTVTADDGKTVVAISLTANG